MDSILWIIDLFKLIADNTSRKAWVRDVRVIRRISPTK